MPAPPEQPLATSRASASSLLAYLLLAPLLGLVCGSMAIGLPGAALGFEIADAPGWLLLSSMIAPAAYVLIRGAAHDLRAYRWVVTETGLRGGFGVKLRFDEVKDLVVGLPSLPPWFVFVYSFPLFRHHLENARRARAGIYVIRLHDGGILPMVLAQAEGGPEVQQAVLARLAEQARTPEAYTASEARLLGRLGWGVAANRVLRP